MNIAEDPNSIHEAGGFHTDQNVTLQLYNVFTPTDVCSHYHRGTAPTGGCEYQFHAPCGDVMRYLVYRGVI